MTTLKTIHKLTAKYYSLKGDEVNKALTVPERHALKRLDELGLLGGIDG